MPAAKEKEYPFYLKATVILFGLVLLTYIMSALTDILVPLAFAGFIAILLNPLCNRLVRLKVPRVLAILISILLALVLVVALFYFLSTQIAQFSQSFPALKQKFEALSHDVSQWIYTKFGVETEKQVGFVKKVLDNSQAMLGHTVGTVLSTLGVVFLLPVYTFMLLFYKTLILNFFFEVFKEDNTRRVAEILQETKNAIQSYIVGLLVEMVIVAVLNSTALMILGVKYAILLGVIGAILNMLPYIGGIIAIALPILMATVTKDGYSTQLGIIAAYLIIQFIDNNIVFPRVVSVKVQINALVSIVIVLLGNALWGISGMFLSVPFVAVLKIIFDRIDDLQPWGKLLGDTVPTRHMGQLWGKRYDKNEVNENLKKKN
ncbi:putative PurR-regulated permease PerM [Mucilaginibacter yixingensis]|uniref:Putative PurR-regulated permease PerM n=1 Tax=Mucilaginibacter yixingensis TaxID=1295612 RepID=A0A2T5JER5_9SPHI|nr:AI-2E family transporter [Mucilaginibacter yixingensis]PTR00884.1 putative PurR-regulated permease PerM [Mucilaginibacter yixingensis]